jgi:predicted anti-sigma-YlaC factor YlaD
VKIMMNHLSEEELILHYYGETERADKVRVADHLASCDDCQAADTQLRRVMTLVDSAPAAEARPGFERDVWARLEPQLVHRSAKREGGWRTLFWAPQWALAGGVAALVLVAFMAGRISNAPGGAAPAPLQAEFAPERVLQAAVGDHLDRTQMMLAELANSDQAGVLATEQERAADLVAVNRVIRASAEQSGDAAIADVLEDLERVLLEIANAPANASSNELTDLQSRITTQDLLFRLRVIASEMRQRTTPDREAGDRTPQRPPTS